MTFIPLAKDSDQSMLRAPFAIQTPRLMHTLSLTHNFKEESLELNSLQTRE